MKTDKRAEELAIAIYKIPAMDDAEDQWILTYADKAAALISAELRKEREAFAKRITGDLEQDSEAHTMFLRSYITERIFAILREED